ncbi:hypothetical protein M2904_02445 [Vagococcus lutrae]|uniref:hypothetical protein n=1 Tax=Vagococcus lutrae TaxID=81947 RepID=UPI0019289324|nr:hypothetical protein [Vagococcus lutrae]UQF23519.1 hypothetical protein M2909_00420 [Vagococcus lutrae]UQF38855.1 hypothetical protein M2904_02445 [Vagococcus lutrae]UQF64396.1 hypothetical protein M2908_01205 [Vagococcus lutrae]GEQ61627.1 hypothetical protein VL2N_09630 [Vagococcus lutrae]GEQ63607.1 hypothetical protein VL3N_10490 [Vagococcus lutrae]
MLKKIKNALIVTVVYLVTANIGNFIFDTDNAIDWTSTLWEAIFFFIFILLLQQFRTLPQDDEQ